MSNALSVEDRTPSEPKGHVIGFIPTQAACEEMLNDLRGSGIPSDRILVLEGPEGFARFHQMMDGSQWGEEAQRVLKEGDLEIKEGHIVIVVETTKRPEALRIAEVGKAHGGISFSHFGTVIDERFTR